MKKSQSSKINDLSSLQGREGSPTPQLPLSKLLLGLQIYSHDLICLRDSRCLKQGHKSLFKTPFKPDRVSFCTPNSSLPLIVRP